MVDRTGQQLGNYRLIRMLSQDGPAEVYLGEDLRLKTMVAIKILHAKEPGSEDMERFYKEAQILARLQHPNILKVLYFGVQGETAFLVMDYAPESPEQSTLRQRHSEGSILPLAIIKSYIMQVASALQYVHDQKLIHRNVKPENMVIGRNSEILLSGFSNVVAAQSTPYQTTLDVVGTADYMAPEQIQGKPRIASDQYSLAIVAYEWLCGARPFHGSFTELYTQHVFAIAPSLREKAATLSQEVEQVVNIALVKDPNKRFASVSAFASAFEQASATQGPTIWFHHRSLISQHHHYLQCSQ